MSKSKKIIALEEENKELKDRLVKSQKVNLVYLELMNKKAKNTGKKFGFTLHKRKNDKWYASKRINDKQKWVYIGTDPTLATSKIEAWLIKNRLFGHIPDEEEKRPLLQEDFAMAVIDLEEKATALLEQAQKLKEKLPARFKDKAHKQSLREDIEQEIQECAQMDYLLSRLKEIQEKEAYKQTVRVKLWLYIERNSKFVRGKKKVREEIEFYILSNYSMKRDGDNYQLTIPHNDEKHLEQIIDEIFKEMHWTADMRHCFIEADMTEIGGDRSWS